MDIDGEFDDLLLDSPYADRNPVKGGEINYKKDIWIKYVMFTVLVIVIIYLIGRLFYRVRIQGEDYNQRQTHNYFNNLHGDAFDNDAKQAIAYGEAIDTPRAIDHFRIGTTYLIAANNPKRAHQHFRQALDQIIQGQVEMKEVPFLLDRIDDYKNHFVNFPEIEELPIQLAMIAHFEAKQNLMDRVAKEKPNISKDDPEFTQKMILAQQNWESDAQNVHDTAVYGELAEQFQKVRSENGRIPNISNKTYREAMQWLKIRYQDDPEKEEKIRQVETYLNNNYKLSHINATEQDLVTTVWQRAYDPENKEHFNEIRDAIGDAVLDCVEGEHVVCADGRSSKIWQSLAKLDKDPSIGILKSKQMIRNEIYERSAKIVDEYIGSNGSASTELKDSYNRDENSEQVKELKECIKGQIDSLANQYKGLLPDEQLQLAIEECKAVV
jgi:hypothetical protein